MKFQARIGGDAADRPGKADSVRVERRQAHTPVRLYAKPDGTDAMTAGASILTRLRRAGLRPTPPAWDFLNIALTVIVADAAALRSRSPDGWTRQIEVDFPVSSPDTWARQQGTLVSALTFLTTDSWNLGFVEGTVPFRSMENAAVTECDSVALLSGGLDSLVGGIDLVASGVKPYFVSHTVRGDRVRQSSYASQLGSRPHIQLSHNARTGTKHETSQRARSLIFIAYGVLVASALQTHRNGGTVDLYINENGFISINPSLTPMRVGSLSTRTAHPRFLRLVQQVLDGVDLNIRIVNPYRFMTKGEMLAACADQDLLRELATGSTSCGRFQRYYKHCGRCLPCQVRRAAFCRWGSEDVTGYRYEDLGQQGRDHAGFDDVRSVAMARLAAAEDGLGNWLGSSLCGVLDSERADTRAMLGRGLDELGVLHDYYHVT